MTRTDNLISQTIDLHFPALASIPELKSELVAVSSIHRFEAGTAILKPGGYIRVIPLLISGLAKVFREEPEHGNEVLLYYIKPGESCVMSITSLMRNEISQVKAVIEEDAEILVIPADKVFDIAKNYPKWNSFFYDLVNFKFDELIHVVEILTFSNKDKRLLEYLKKEVELKGTTILRTTHQHIAYDLGSSREVISRLLKKLELDGILKLKKGTIELL